MAQYSKAFAEVDRVRKGTNASGGLRDSRDFNADNTALDKIVTTEALLAMLDSVRCCQ